MSEGEENLIKQIMKLKSKETNIVLDYTGAIMTDNLQEIIISFGLFLFFLCVTYMLAKLPAMNLGLILDFDPTVNIGFLFQRSKQSLSICICGFVPILWQNVVSVIITITISHWRNLLMAIYG